MAKSEVGAGPKEFTVYATLDEASRLTGLSGPQIRAWHTAQVVIPFLVRGASRGARTRLYDFADLVSLRILARVHGKVPTPELRKVQAVLRERPQAEWTGLRFLIEDRRLTTIDAADRERSPASTPTQIEVGRVASELRGEIEQSRERGSAVVGKILRDPAVMGGAWVIAGTRIPTEAIWSFHEAGYDVDSIIEQYPRLLLTMSRPRSPYGTAPAYARGRMTPRLVMVLIIERERARRRCGLLP
jgi:uncharacterized protein (DUF433 family)